MSGAYQVVTVADGGITVKLDFVKADNPTASFEADIEKAAGISRPKFETRSP